MASSHCRYTSPKVMRTRLKLNPQCYCPMFKHKSKMTSSGADAFAD